MKVIEFIIKVVRAIEWLLGEVIPFWNAVKKYWKENFKKAKKNERR